MNIHALIRVVLFPFPTVSLLLWLKSSSSGSRVFRLLPASRGARHPVRSVEDLHPTFLDLKGFEAPGALEKAELLVLPYGSAVPAVAGKP